MANLQESIAIDTKLRTLEGRRASFDLIGITIEDEASATVTLGNNGVLDVTQGKGGISSSSGPRRFFSEPQISLYQDSAIAANQVPNGDNISVGDYKLWYWVDWGSTDINNLEISFKTVLLNLSGSSQTIIYKANIRSIIT